MLKHGKGGQHQKPTEAFNLLKVRSMFLVLLTLALWPCDAVKDEKVGMVVRSSALTRTPSTDQ